MGCMFTASFYQVTPVGTAIGVGISKSPKEAFAKAVEASEVEYRALCNQFKSCLSVGVDGWRMRLNNKLIGRFDNI
jgi:hypothetical protein